MKKQLTKSESRSLLPNIQRVLDTGQSWESDDLHYPAGAIIDAVLSINGVSKKEGESFDTNGWQYDWWQHFIFKGEEYTLSGSGYYGGHGFYVSDC